MSDTKKYNTTLAWLWKARNSDNLFAVPVKTYDFEAAQAIHEGGKYVVKFFTEEQKDRMRAKKPDKTPPDAVIEFMSKEDVDEFNNRVRI